MSKASKAVVSQPRSNWLPVAAYALVAAANQALWLSFAPITTEAATHYGVSTSAIGWLSQVFPLIYVVLALPAGLLLDRWFRPSLAFGAVLTAVGAVIRLGGDEFAIVVVGQVIIAIAQPFVLNAVTKLAISYVRDRDRPNGIAAGSAGIFGGMVLALVLGATFGGNHIPGLLLVQAVFAVVAAIFLCAVLSRSAPQFATSAMSVVDRPLRQVWSDTYIRLLVAVVFVGFGIFVALTTWLQALLAPAGVSETQAGVLLISMVVAGVIGCAVLPSWAVRHGRVFTVVGCSIAVTAVGCVLFAIIPSFVFGLPISILVGLLLIANLPIILEMTERRAGASSGTATALIWLAGNAGGLVVAVLVQQLLGYPAAAFIFMAVVVLIAAPLVLKLARWPKQVQADQEVPG